MADRKANQLNKTDEQEPNHSVAFTDESLTDLESTSLTIDTINIGIQTSAKNINTKSSPIKIEPEPFVSFQDSSKKSETPAQGKHPGFWQNDNVYTVALFILILLGIGLVLNAVIGTILILYIVPSYSYSVMPVIGYLLLAVLVKIPIKHFIGYFIGKKRLKKDFPRKNNFDLTFFIASIIAALLGIFGFVLPQVFAYPFAVPAIMFLLALVFIAAVVFCILYVIKWRKMKLKKS
ncbi:MAG: hypothetical protein GC180_09870 [Bacteroidetes bacterium]|nr:hypothetical protein [Bacteroidota bacterium]